MVIFLLTSWQQRAWVVWGMYLWVIVAVVFYWPAFSLSIHCLCGSDHPRPPPSSTRSKPHCMYDMSLRISSPTLWPWILVPHGQGTQIHPSVNLRTWLGYLAKRYLLLLGLLNCSDVSGSASPHLGFPQKIPSDKERNGKAEPEDEKERERDCS